MESIHGENDFNMQGNMQIISWSTTLLFWWLLWSHGIDLTMNYGEVSVTLQNHANEVIIRKEVSVREVLCGKLTVKETGFLFFFCTFSKYIH